MEINMTTITMMGVIVAAVGVVFAVLALHRRNRLTSITLVADALKVFAADGEMQAVFYEIEYGDFRYGGRHGGGFHKTEKERRTDKLLRHFAAIAHAWNNGLIRQEDMVLVHYYTSRILANGEVREYLKFLLDEWAKSQKLKHPYHALIKLGELQLPSSE